MNVVLPDLGLDRNRALVRSDEFLADGKAETEADVTGREQRLEHAAKMLRLDTAAGIGNLNDDRLALPPRGHAQRPAAGHGLSGICEQVAEYRDHLPVVNEHVGQAGPHVE